MAVVEAKWTSRKQESRAKPVGFEAACRPWIENRFHVEARVALSTVPSQHHPVPYGQADILNARVGLDETVKGDDGV
jgi:hypothetical protein